MREANGIVFASPVYVDNVTGQMKIFIDRLADAIHYQVLTGKYSCAVTTTYESGGNEVESYLNHVLNYLGVISVGGISIATQGAAGAIDAVPVPDLIQGLNHLAGDMFVPMRERIIVRI